MPDLGRLDDGRPGARIVPIPNLKRGLTMIDLMLPELIEHVRRETFRPEYADKVTEQEILGIILARHFKWDGRACFETLTHALEDSNFHAVNRKLGETWNQWEGVQA